MKTDSSAAGTVEIQRASSGDPLLDSFLGGGFPRGSLIFVSGNPGTGKSTLCAEFVYHGSKVQKENGIYVSFSESKQSFFENMSSVGLDFESLEKEGHFRFLEMFSGTAHGMADIAKLIVAEIKRLEAKRLVIDSYSVMAQAMGNQYEGRQLLHTFFTKITRNMGSTTLLIGEQPTGELRIGDASEEFVADGVLNLKLTIPRELEIRKMRGTSLKKRDLLYTLDGGFRIVSTSVRAPVAAKRWQPIPDSNDRLSTGSPDLDSILGGGFPRGTYLVLEVSNDVTIGELRIFLRGLILNFIAQKRGVVEIPGIGVDADDIVAALSPYAAADDINSFLRISQPVHASQPESRPRSLPPYVVPVPFGEGAHEEEELAKNSDVFDTEEASLKARTGNKPILRVIAYDSLEASYARYPERLLNEMGSAMNRTKARGDLSIAIAKSSVTILPKIVGMADLHIRFSMKDRVLLSQGVKPTTNVYAVDCDVSKGYPVMKLTILI